MQNKINNDVHRDQSLNPLNGIVKVSSNNNSSDLLDVFTKIGKLKKLWHHGTKNFDLIRYLPGIAKILRKGKFYNVLLKKLDASPNWSDMKMFEFSLILAANTTTIFSNMYLCIPMQIKNKQPMSLTILTQR